MMTLVAPARVRREDVDDAVGALHREHYRSLVRLVSVLLDDVGDCEEVVQEAFVQLHVRWDRLRDPARAPAWLRSAALNGARSRLRHRQVIDRHPPPASGVAESAEAGAMAVTARDEVLAALRTLPPRQREALALRFYLDLSEAEMAEAMGVTSGSVKTHVHRGLAALAQRLGEER
jgi:RNA polymerase sigma-70 factor (sigma-E family)